MELTITAKYLLIPAGHYAAKKRLLFLMDGEPVYDLQAALEEDEPDYVFPVDMSRFLGRTLTLSCEPEISLHLTQTDDPPLDYSGKYRPWAHFTARRGWINDPNGLIRYQDRYLMYYQHNPVATTWENMHWGSAWSEDLIHWHEGGDVLYPDRQGTCFSGSAIRDEEGRAGLGRDTLLCYYTCAGNTSRSSAGRPFTQRLAFSTDGGRTLQPLEAPVLGHLVDENRDPKVIRYAPDGGYVMALYLTGHEFALFRSEDLLHWRELQRLTLPEDAECPDFYPLPMDGDPQREKWVFIAASDRYMIGSFDGQRFVPETEQLRLNYGNASYAAQTWSDTPGRRIRTAFINTVIPGMPFGCCMDIPQELSLRTIGGQPRLCVRPVGELETLYAGTVSLRDVPVTHDSPLTLPVKGKACDVTLTVAAEAPWRLSLFGLAVDYDPAAATLTCGDRTAPVPAEEGQVTLRIIYDTLCAEIFAAQGSVYMGMTFIQDSMLRTLTLTSASARVSELRVSELRRWFGEADVPRT